MDSFIFTLPVLCFHYAPCLLPPNTRTSAFLFLDKKKHIDILPNYVSMILVAHAHSCLGKSVLLPLSFSFFLDSGVKCELQHISPACFYFNSAHLDACNIVFTLVYNRVWKSIDCTASALYNQESTSILSMTFYNFTSNRFVISVRCYNLLFLWTHDKHLNTGNSLCTKGIKTFNIVGIKTSVLL